MADQIEGINPVEPRKNIYLFLPDPHSCSIAMEQNERFALSTNDKENGLTFNFNGLWNQRRIPINPIWPNQRKATTAKQGSQQEGNDPSKVNHGKKPFLSPL